MILSNRLMKKKNLNNNNVDNNDKGAAVNILVERIYLVVVCQKEVFLIIKRRVTKQKHF